MAASGDGQPRRGPELQPGQRVGSYVIQRQVGSGGWGAVYLAEQPAIGRKVAVKVLRKDLSADDDAAARFFTEARAANSIRSEHVVEVLDFGRTEDGRPFLIMEWLEGQSLADLLRREGKLSTPRALHFARQAARALAEAHRSGVIHRDLKPDNLFLQERERDHEYVKVLDFGIAKLMHPEEVTHRTSTGQTLGTPYYMSPEQCEGARALDQRSDIYSFGIILYEILTGVRPFRAEGLGAVIVQQMQQAPVPPRQIEASIPVWLEAAILRMLEKDPARRQASMDVVLASLAPGATDDFGAETTSERRPAMRPQRRPASSREIEIAATLPGSAPASRPTTAQATTAEVAATRPLRARNAILVIAALGIGAAAVGIWPSARPTAMVPGAPEATAAAPQVRAIPEPRLPAPAVPSPPASNAPDAAIAAPGAKRASVKKERGRLNPARPKSSTQDRNAPARRRLEDKPDIVIGD